MERTEAILKRSHGGADLNQSTVAVDNYRPNGTGRSVHCAEKRFSTRAVGLQRAYLY